MATLEQFIGDFFATEINKDKSDIACLKRALLQFCKTGKKADAFSVYYCFCEIFEVLGSGYGSMNRLLEFLYDHENHMGELLTKHRDHYSHSVYVFALGLAIFAKNEAYRKVFLDFYKTKNADATAFLRLWGLTALFHDIGYPFQLAHEQIKAYAHCLWGEDNPIAPFIAYENMDELLTLGGRIKNESRFDAVQTVDEMLAYAINYRLGYPIHDLRSQLAERYKHQSRYMDHGYFSAVLLFNRLAEANTPFTDEIADVLTAITLHNNFNRYDIKEALKKNVAIPESKHPLAYLLVLCDELQDWDRTAFGYVSKKDPLAWKVELSIENGKIDICYVFDSFKVMDTEEIEIDDPENKDKKITEIKETERDNKNYVKFAQGKFLGDIKELVDGKTALAVTVREQSKAKKGKAFVSTDNFINLCDFAQAIHKSYQSVWGGPNFDEMDLEFRLSNIEQAKSYSDKLELINCFYSDKELDYPVVNAFSEGDGSNVYARNDLEFLAREEHLRWVREKLAAGWKYGTDYANREERNEKRIHKDIVPYDVLSDDDRKKDELLVKNMIPFLYHFGHGVRIYRYRGGRKPVLDIAGCGHRTIPKNNEHLKEQIKAILREYQKDYLVIVHTNFAYGADQLIAECANELGITIKATLPMPYEEYIQAVKNDAARYHYSFTADDEYRMRHLLAQAVTCNVVPDSEFRYLEAAKYTISRCKKLIALWDGVETVLEDKFGNPMNRGGTWHSICIAKDSRGLTDDDIHIIKCNR